MKTRLVAITTIAVLTIAAAAFAATPVTPAKAPAKTTTPAPAMTHGMESHGKVVSVDDAKKTFVINVDGKDTTVYWTQATKVEGGKLAANEMATVRWMEKDGHKTATSVKVAR